MEGFFFYSVFLGSVDVNNTFMRIKKMILIVFYKICCINIQTLLILINYNKGHTIVIMKTKIV